MSRRWLALLVLALLSSAGCSTVHDGWFANPCARELVVRTFDAGADEPDERDPIDAIAEGRVQANGVTKIEDAFDDADAWFVEVDGDEAFRVTRDAMPEWIVAIPATVCA